MKLLVITVIMSLSAAFAEAETQDSVRTTDLQAVEVVSDIRESGNLRQQTASVSLIGEQQIADNHITSLKGVSSVVPNLFIPDYGSRLTSAVYIRGVGSRIGTPAVGLYVDNMPFADKSAFDFNFYDIDRIEVMRGPQGTLYGRNAMGGMMKVFTRNPLYYQGTTLNLGYTTRDNSRRISVMHYHRPSNKFAFSAGGYYNGTSGLFRNDITGKKVDAGNEGGGKLRALWLPTKRLTLDMNASYDFTNEGAYPYYYQGKITSNRESRYKRGLLNIGIGVNYHARKFIMTSMTSYQNIADRMYMDQDFIWADIYTLEQKQHINTLSEEITFRNTNSTRWERISGVSLMKQWLHTEGPVTFYSDGISWLQSTINSYMPNSMSMTFDDKTIVMGGKFETPVFNAAMFHQSTYHFNRNFSATLGLRLDYEHNSIHYNAPASVNYSFTMSLPRRTITLPGLQTNITELNGVIQDDYIKVLPKFALKYDINEKSNIYLSIAKGMRSGGYNVQMFSDILQSALKTKMMNGRGKDITLEMPTSEVQKVVEYKPEYSWNYELGTHLALAQNRIRVDAAMFYIHTYDQQIARFTDSGLGRMMVNAGRSESYGAELSALWQIIRQLQLTANYGFTNAKFTAYDAGTGQDYTGNYVPFVPMHTTGADLAYTLPLQKKGFWKSMTFGVNYSGAGRIYWTESNNASQSYYNQLGARIGLQTKLFTLQVWGRNLTNAKYNTFYFESAGRSYEQHCRPIQFGVDVKFEF